MSKAERVRELGLLTCEPICQCGHVDVQHGPSGHCAEDMCSCPKFQQCRAVEDLVQWAYEKGFQQALTDAAAEGDQLEQVREVLNRDLNIARERVLTLELENQRLRAEGDHAASTEPDGRAMCCRCDWTRDYRVADDADRQAAHDELLTHAATHSEARGPLPSVEKV